VQCQVEYQRIASLLSATCGYVHRTLRHGCGIDLISFPTRNLIKLFFKFARHQHSFGDAASSHNWKCILNKRPRQLRSCPGSVLPGLPAHTIHINEVLSAFLQVVLHQSVLHAGKPLTKHFRLHIVAVGRQISQTKLFS